MWLQFLAWQNKTYKKEEIVTSLILHWDYYHKILEESCDDFENCGSDFRLENFLSPWEINSEK